MRQSLTRRLLLAMFPWYLVPALALMLVQLAIQYFTIQATLRSDLSSLARTIAPSLASALWQLDGPELATMAGAIRESSLVTGVLIESDHTAPLSVGEVPPQGSGLEGHSAWQTAVSQPLTFQPQGGASRTIGRLHLYAGETVLWAHLKYGSVSILVNSLLAASGLWLIVSLILRTRLEAEIRAVAEAVGNWRAKGEGEAVERIAYPYRDELGDLVQALNQSRSLQQSAVRQLNHVNRGLEDTVAERTRELRLAKDRAESADRTKSAFLATMSHELRTPLNSIIGFTGILLQGLAGPLAAEQDKQLGMVRASARHLLALINDVLDISRIEAGQLPMAHASYRPEGVLERAVASVRPLADRKGLTLDIALACAPTEVHGDPRRVEQVLLNLLGNAVKFTDRGKVAVSLHRVGADEQPAIRLDESDQGAWHELRLGDFERVARPAICIRVADTGIGIAGGNMRLLFQPFQQIDTKLSRTHEGTGLGLAICGRLASLMGGAMGVASCWGKGSVFLLLLPVDAPPKPGNDA